MNGVHDMGGMQGFGPVLREPGEPVFHAEWEARAFALTLAMATPGGWNIDMGRHARERLAPGQYLTSSYYQIWLAGLKTMIMEAGLATAEEMETGVASTPPAKVRRILKADQVAEAMRRGGPADRDPGNSVAGFAAGDRVRVRNFHPTGHTRAPRYLRGARGEISTIHGFHVFPDASAAGKGDQPQWLYSVRFSARDLWGDDANPADHVHADLWESYLEPV